jgi:hypothetical protein
MDWMTSSGLHCLVRHWRRLLTQRDGKNTTRRGNENTVRARPEPWARMLLRRIPPSAKSDLLAHTVGLQLPAPLTWFFVHAAGHPITRNAGGTMAGVRRTRVDFVASKPLSRRKGREVDKTIGPLTFPPSQLKLMEAISSHLPAVRLYTNLRPTTGQAEGGC